MVILRDIISKKIVTAVAPNVKPNNTENSDSYSVNNSINSTNNSINKISKDSIDNSLLVNKTLLFNETTLKNVVDIVTTNHNNKDNQRKQKRLPLKTTLYLRRPFNSAMYGKPVQTVDISANGLLVLCDVSLEVGAELEVTNISRQIIVTAIVKHVAKDPKSNKYLLGLSISEKKTSWLVNELAEVDYFSKSSTSRKLSLNEDYIC